MQTFEKPTNAWLVSGEFFNKIAKDMNVINYDGKLTLVKIEKIRDLGITKYYGYCWMVSEFMAQTELDRIKTLGYNVVIMSAEKKDKIKTLFEIPSNYELEKAFNVEIEKLVNI